MQGVHENIEDKIRKCWPILEGSIAFESSHRVTCDIITYRAFLGLFPNFFQLLNLNSGCHKVPYTPVPLFCPQLIEHTR